jgi:ectoine hydroxylase-related dioxygenase (phytanoyl-CoA dioxygenase family)
MRKHNTIAAELNPGDCVFFSGKLLHGGGANKTANELRRCVALSMVRMGLMPEHAYPLLTPIEVADTLTYRAQAMLGFRSLWPPSATGTAGYLWTKDYLEVGRFIGLKDKPLYPTGIATSG